MMKPFAMFIAAAITLPAAAFCQPAGEEPAEIVVTATRIETPVDEVSGTILVVTSEEIEKKQARTVADALRGMPGVDLVTQGGPGKTSSVLLRGGDTRFTLVLVDGVEVNDPSNPERTFDFAHMTTSDIERIEVLFGPQSTLYGSDAIGGVIHIITKKGAVKPHLEAQVEGGSFETRREASSFGQKSGLLSYFINAQHVKTEGISAASRSDGNTERDGYENLSLAATGTLDLGAGSLRLDIRSTDASNELDYYGGPGGDDPNFTGDAEHLLLSGQLTLYPADIWESSLKVSSSAHDRHNINRPDPVRPFTMELDFEGRTRKVELLNNFYISDRSTVTLGLDWEEETGESRFFSDEFGPFTSVLAEESARIEGAFLQEQYSAASGFTMTLGARADEHSDFGGATTWRAGISWPLSRTIRFRTVYGTGFRAPSIDQLHNPDYGNPDLDAEHSRGWDAGLEATVGKRLRGFLSWHYTEYDDLIAWFDADGDPSTWWDGSYENISSARTRGVDLSVSTALGRASVGLNGSWLSTEDDQGDELLRRPEISWAGRFAYSLSERVELAADMSYVGEREDWGGVTLDSYTLWNLAGSFELDGGFSIFGRVENLTDEEYERAGGYGTPGRAFYGGVKARFL